MEKRFLKVAQDGHFFDKHQKILVAVSGGNDSMALLECLLATKESLQLDIGIAHVNHQQRRESDEEEAYLRSFAQELGLPIYVRTYRNEEFTEKKARDFRYRFFKELMRDHDYTALVTAHHADDQAETILMRFLRGSRLRHLSGIQTVQEFGPGQLIRPFLSFKKSELQAKVFFEDASNQEETYFRNRIRNHYLPQLQRENPKFADYLLDFGQENALLFQALQDLTKDVDIRNLAQFKEQTLPVQYFLLQEYLANFPDLELGRAQFEEVLFILRSKANYCHPLKNGYFLNKNYQYFEIFKILPETDENKEELVIESEGIFEFGKAIFSLEQELSDADQLLYVEKEKPIRIRYRKPGDKLFIRGIHKKLRRFFIDEKISKDQRKDAIIIEQNKKILGVANLVTSDLSKSLKNDIMKAKLYIKMKE